MKKRWLAMLMAAIMCLSLLPMSALATESSPPEPPDDSGSSTETVTKTITVDANVTDEESETDSTYATIQAAIDYIAGLDVTKDPGARDDWTIHVKNGEYERFTVPHFNSSQIANLTIVGESEEGVKVDVLTIGTTVERNDNGGINIYGQDVMLKNMTIIAGNINGDKYAAISTHHGDVGGRNVSLTVDNCTLIGPGIGNGATYGIFWDCDRVEVTNCNISGFANAIEFMNDNINIPAGKTYSITNNTISDVSFAFHGYFAGTPKEGETVGTLAFTNNKVTGTDSLRCKIVIQDGAGVYDSTTKKSYCTNPGALKVNITDNTLENTVIGLVNLDDEGETLSDVLKSNTFGKNSYFVNAHNQGDKNKGQVDVTAAYSAGASGLENSYWKLNDKTGLSNANYVQSLINEANANHSDELTIAIDDKGNLLETFTAFKDAIYWVSEAPETPEQPDKWDEGHSKSKSATDLDKNYESQVTLSLPSAQETLVSDVVFVLDKSTSAELENQALDMLQNLKKQVDDTNAKVKVGVVIFNKEANVANYGNFFDLSTQYGKIENAIKQNISSGTNTHAGLLAGKAMLDGDTSVDANRKYLIFVSDGNSYMYGEAPWASDFMNYLADGEDVDFDDIKKDIYYLLAAGSTVTDVIGSGTDNKGNDYDFDFVNDVDKLTLKVGEDTYTTTTGAITETDTHETARYTFTHDGVDATNDAETPFVLHYYENGVDGNSAECFVWDINVPVTNFAPVSLTYAVKLTNPQSASGTYGEWDQYGENKKTSLYTNNRATLSPVDSNGNVGELEWFAKPTVSYTVKSSGGGGGGGGSSKPPVLNTEDHFGYIIGYPEHYLTGEACHDQTLMPVKPEGNITRAEVATIFFRMLTDESRNEFWSQTSSYADVELDDWFNNAICTLSNAGVINGYEDGTFKPNGKITRAEFATIASRFFEYADENMENPFSDVEENTWYYQYIMAASDMGLINGYPDGTFKPDNLITRAEAVTIVNRTLDRHPDQENFLEDMLVWPDNMDTEKWYYADMQEATNSHEYQMKTKNGEKYEVWTKMLPIRDWEAFEKAWSDANSSNNPGEVVK